MFFQVEVGLVVVVVVVVVVVAGYLYGIIKTKVTMRPRVVLQLVG